MGQDRNDQEAACIREARNLLDKGIREMPLQGKPRDIPGGLENPAIAAFAANIAADRYKQCMARPARR